MTAVAPAADGHAIQAAIDALPAGGVVDLAPGVHPLVRPLRVHSGITLRGAGREHTALTLVAGADTHVMVNRDPHEGNEAIALRHLTIDGNRPEQSLPPKGTFVFAFGVWFRKVRGLVLEDVGARQVRQNGVQLNDCSDVTIHGLAATDMGWSGLGATRTTGLEARGLTVHRAGLDTTHSGIHLDGAVDVHLDGLAHDCTGNALMVDSVAGEVRRVTLRGDGRRSAYGLAVVAGDEHPLEDVDVTGTFAHNRSGGVLVSNATRVSIRGATITDNEVAGVRLQGRTGCRACAVTDSAIWGSPETVMETGGTAGTTVTGIRTSRAPDVGATW